MRAKIIATAKNDAAKPLRFMFVGGIATLVHMCVAAAVLSARPESSAFLANVIAFVVAFLASFYGHRHLTFSTRGSMRRFFIVAVAGFALNNVILSIGLALSAPKLIAIIIATAFVPVLTYLASSMWAFKKK
ncbi:GtrA family protein [Kushneria phosphatilytica]|uniref:GtrA family protein n=1 Tax=Kushneria phosphatilytica TaxID=657387 RepID=A0A1S1NZ63_9GAMM|nr:GtrA family protein [Kushneria phosphatilytica]OHV13022.1 hypothetical protein BH688_03195 [Kushneria phosphatilytica]QEL10894.1 GtrA family protein [Kushneria phosphatilytica]